MKKRIDGLVITFYDISGNKKLEAELRKAQAALEVRFSEQTAELDRTKPKLDQALTHERRRKGANP